MAQLTHAVITLAQSVNHLVSEMGDRLTQDDLTLLNSLLARGQRTARKLEALDAQTTN